MRGFVLDLRTKFAVRRPYHLEDMRYCVCDNKSICDLVKNKNKINQTTILEGGKYVYLHPSSQRTPNIIGLSCYDEPRLQDYIFLVPRKIPVKQQFLYL